MGRLPALVRVRSVVQSHSAAPVFLGFQAISNWNKVHTCAQAGTAMWHRSGTGCSNDVPRNCAETVRKVRFSPPVETYYGGENDIHRHALFVYRVVRDFVDCAPLVTCTTLPICHPAQIAQESIWKRN